MENYVYNKFVVNEGKIMRNWIIVLLIFVVPLGLYGYIDAKAQSGASSCKVEPLGAAAPIAIKKPKIIKFSSPMCSECKETTVEVKKAMKDLKDDVVVEEINVLETNSAAQNDTKAAIKKYKISLVPTLVFLDKDGNVIKKKEGLMKSEEIIKVVDGIK